MKTHGIFRNLFVCTALALVTMMAFDVKADLIVAYNIEAASPSAAIFTNAYVSVSDLVFSANGVNGTADWLPSQVAYYYNPRLSDTPTTSDILASWSVTPTNNATITLDAIGGATAGMRVYEQASIDGTLYGKLFVASDAAFTTILAESDIVTSYSASNEGPVTNASINSAISSSATLYFGFAMTQTINGTGNAQARFDDFKVNGQAVAPPAGTVLIIR